MRLASVDSSNISASVIPLLGDGAASDTLLAEMGPIKQGSPVVASLTNGPVFIPTMQVPTFAAGTPKNGATGWWGVWAKQTLQDYRAFSAVHRGVANILFADMSVRTFKDQNRDGMLNNGFPAINGFADSEVEITPNEIESRYSVEGN